MKNITRTISTKEVKFYIVSVGINGEVLQGEELTSYFPNGMKEDKIRKILQKEYPNKNIIVKSILESSKLYTMDLETFIKNAQIVEK